MELDLLGLSKMESRIQTCALEELHRLKEDVKGEVAEAKLAELRNFRQEVLGGLVPIEKAIEGL